jgi:hypothetical protein
LTDELVTENEVVEAVVAELAPPVGDKKDYRKKNVRKAIGGLLEAAYIYKLDGKLGVKG